MSSYIKDKTIMDVMGILLMGDAILAIKVFNFLAENGHTVPHLDDDYIARQEVMDTDTSSPTPLPLSREQAVIIGAYTGYLVGPTDDLRKYIEKKLGRNIKANDLSCPPVVREVKQATIDDFESLTAGAKHE